MDMGSQDELEKLFYALLENKASKEDEQLATATQDMILGIDQLWHIDPENNTITYIPLWKRGMMIE